MLVNASYKIKDLKLIDMQLSVLYVVICTETSTGEVFIPKRSSPLTVTDVSLVGTVHGMHSCGFNTLMLDVPMHIAT